MSRPMPGLHHRCVAGTPGLCQEDDRSVSRVPDPRGSQFLVTRAGAGAKAAVADGGW
ncbi:MAG: hypothetical protein SFV23_17605 [Planctomycetaceae bacterium]|nr:hypothetical protein [Planctomycetaceae bacterium]